MDSSLGFVSISDDYNRAYHTRFRFGFGVTPLNLAI